MDEWRARKCKGLVYLCTSKTEAKSYVGLTRRPFNTRVNGHEKDAIAGRGKDGSLQEAIRRHGFDDFSFSIIDRAKTLGELSDKERNHIKQYKTLKPYGYNHNRGGSVSGGGIPFEFMGEIYLSLAHIADEFDVYEETLRYRVAVGWSMRQATGLDDPPVNKIEGEYWKFGEYEFISTSELCKHFELNERTFRARLEAGWPMLQACGLVDRDQNTHLFEGKEYSSIKKLAKAYNLQFERVGSRLKAGLSLKEAMDPNENPYRFGKKPIEIDAINYASISEAAKKLNLTKAKLVNRLEYLNPEKSKAKLVELKKTKYVKKERVLVVEGRSFDSIMKLSRHYKLPEATIRHRLNRGQPIEKAVGLIKEKSTFPLDFAGCTFNSLTEIAEYYGIKPKTFSYRFNVANWSLEESLGLIKKDVETETIIVNGRKFPSQNAVARHFGIKDVTFKGRIGRGWTLEEACNLKPRTKIQAGRRVYVVKHPDGTEETVSNMAEFGRIHNLLSSGGLSLTIKSSKHHSYKGFTARYASEEEIAKLIEKDPKALTARTNHQVSHLVEYNGKKYRSKRYLCQKFGISLSMFSRQINNGASIDDAVKYCKKKL